MTISPARERSGLVVGLMILLSVVAVLAEPSPGKRPVPPGLETAELAGFEKLSEPRQELIRKALALRKQHPKITYRYGGDSPEEGAFDCSGAVYFILRSAGLNPARSSAGQFQWVKKAGLIHQVPADAGTLDHKAFKALRPGDLLFWSGTYQPDDGSKVRVTHVQMYLGRLKDGRRHVMIGASNGRSFGGKPRNGFGVFDFRLPRAGSKATFVGYGPPPGLLP